MKERENPTKSNRPVPLFSPIFPSPFQPSPSLELPRVAVLTTGKPPPQLATGVPKLGPVFRGRFEKKPARFQPIVRARLLRVLGNIIEGMVWPECFIKIADKTMAVFFRFGEGVARSNKEPQKLFKLLDMFDSL